MICCECDQEIRSGVISEKDAVALNKKLLGRNVCRLFCEDCLAEYLGVSVDDLAEKVNDFKEQGCTLFQ
jgi:biotin operon repressor